jgi:hypothetical protein
MTRRRRDLWRHETEVHVAVLLHNGNIWFYPALDVWHAPSSAEPEALGIAPHTGAWSREAPPVTVDEQRRLYNLLKGRMT